MTELIQKFSLLLLFIGSLTGSKIVHTMSEHCLKNMKHRNKNIITVTKPKEKEINKYETK